MMFNSKKHCWPIAFDWFFIIVVLTYKLSMVGEMFLNVIWAHQPYNLFVLVVLSHYIRFGFHCGFIFLLKKKFIPVLFLGIYLIDVVQTALISDGFRFVGILVTGVNALLFMSYLFNMLKFYSNRGENALAPILKPYCAYSVYNISTIILMFFLIIAGLTWETNFLDSTKVSLLKGHEDWRLLHYFPYHICMVADFHNGLFPIPTLMGLSHEAHVIMFLITPAVFFLLPLYRKPQLVLLLVAYFFILAETTSTTAILCAGAVLLVELSHFLLMKRKFSTLIFIIIISGATIYYFREWIDIIQFQITYKLDGEDRSGETSSTMLTYLYGFKSVFGYGNFPPEYGLKVAKYNAGIVIGLLDLVLFFKLAWVSIRCFFKQNSNYHYIALGCIYFLLHSLKIAYMSFGYMYFAFMVFIITYLDNNVLESQDKQEPMLFRK